MTHTTFDALAREQRRTPLLALLESSPQDAGVAPLAGEPAPTDVEQRTRTKTYHVHWPELEDYGCIEWDEDGHEVHLGRRFEDIRPLLERMSDHAEMADQNGQPKP